MTRILCFACTALAFLSSCQDSRLKLCDITQSDCQRDIYYADLRLRGDGYDPFGGIPPIRTISEQDFRDELTTETETSPPTPPYWTAALALLGLAPLDLGTASIDNQVENAAAYYSPHMRAVTVIAHPSQSSDATVQFNNMDTLAHELVHALQDRELDLNLESGSTDDVFASKALIEGDASLTGFLFSLSLYDDLVAQGTHKNTLASQDRDPFLYFSSWRAANLSDKSDVKGNFASIAPPFFAAQWLVYPLGGAWLADSWDKGGNAAVRHAYGRAPKRSLDFLLGPGTTPPPSKDIVCQPAISAEFRDSTGRYYGLDSFGAIELFAYLMAWKVPSSDSVASALLWRNDLVFVYYNETTQKTAVAWRIELASPLSPSVLTAITTTDGPRVLQTGSTLLITASDDAAFMATWNPSTACP